MDASALAVTAGSHGLEWWHAIVLGLVEGITEYLPVSSTGHLIVTGDLLKIASTPAGKHALDTFCVVIQGGAILAVLGLYWPRFVQMLRGLLGRDSAGLKLLINVAIAFVPAAVLGLLLKKWIETNLFSTWPVVFMFIIGGIYMIFIDGLVINPRRSLPKGDPGGGLEVTDLSPRGALLIGLLQCVSLWPGTSRSMMTITGGVLSGLRPAAAAEFSFLLGMPTLLAATGYSLYKDLAQPASDGSGGGSMVKQLGLMPVLLGSAVAAVAAWVAVKWLVGVLNRYGLLPFGVYRIVFGAVLAGLVLAGLVTVD